MFYLGRFLLIVSDALNSILHSVPTYPSVFIAIFNCEMASQVVVKESAPWQHAPHSTHSNHPNAGASRGCSISTRSASSYRRRRPLIENRGRSSLQKYEGEHRHVEAMVEGGVNYEAAAGEPARLSGYLRFAASIIDGLHIITDV